jgi:hypothetical protein
MARTPGFIYGGDTGVADATELTRRRQIVDALLDTGTMIPRNEAEGLTVFGRAIIGKLRDRSLSKKEDAERARVKAQAASVIQPASYSQPAYSPGSDGNAIKAGLVARGLPDHIADGFVMNMKDESGLNPGINEAKPLVPGSRGGFGLYQLTGPRRQGYERFAAERGVSPDNTDAQLDYLIQELQGSERGAAADIFATETPGQAAAAIVNKFLRPAEQHRREREARYLGGDPGRATQLAEIAQNPYTEEGTRAIANALLKTEMQAMQPADPMDAINLERAQLELDQLRNPVSEPGFSMLSAEDVAAAGLPPGVYQRGPDGRIDTIEKTQGAVDPLADIRARAAAGGLVEGTPEYQQFMLNNGKTPDGMSIESDGQGGFRMTQGAGVTQAKPFTEGQSKDVVFATRAEGALETLEPIADSLTNRGDIALGYIPFGLGNELQSPNFQVSKTAGEDFLLAILRKDTGAAVTNEEQALYGVTYLPQPGDSPERLAYKSQARRRAIEAIKAGMGPTQIIAQERALQQSGSQGTSPAAMPAPDLGLSEDDLKYLEQP